MTNTLIDKKVKNTQIKINQPPKQNKDIQSEIGSTKTINTNLDKSNTTSNIETNKLSLKEQLEKVQNNCDKDFYKSRSTMAHKSKQASSLI